MPFPSIFSLQTQDAYNLFPLAYQSFGTVINPWHTPIPSMQRSFLYVCESNLPSNFGVTLSARVWSCWVPSCCFVCLWLETFLGSLPSQPALILSTVIITSKLDLLLNKVSFLSETGKMKTCIGKPLFLFTATGCRVTMGHESMLCKRWIFVENLCCWDETLETAFSPYGFEHSYWRWLFLLIHTKIWFSADHKYFFILGSTTEPPPSNPTYLLRKKKKRATTSTILIQTIFLRPELHTASSF